ncbi:MAG: putative ATP-dependent DNA helicase [Candidatus Doudnabacteria bacterium Gr01-1014_77]|uniref:Putative ATP-dependent DNA helicase n=1 Tax=Candidatus Doudnabacteria bacterium Gr01-1014_77 TaxID=2017133 RepID=A0A554JBJ0_9BACT|nr:MAG: putative ATP-dependent DNA helicase [Candidatus Doudnabacteria bacterium Gr01-1014_77]
MVKKQQKLNKGKSTVFCSLDIETSGFDPLESEVLELGMVFFEIENKEIKILSEWQSVFKPTKEVPPRILALTGISQEELDQAESFKEKYDDIQNLVKDCVIVGHNINFDIKFLEGFGIKFSGKQIDTLDLAQMFLPNNQSYNLEALMNFLEVDHKDAHRALADAKAVLVVIERLLQYFATFSEKLKKELRDFFPSKKFPEFSQFLETDFKPREIKVRERNLEMHESKEITKALEEDQKIVTFPLGFEYQSYIYGALKKTKEKILLVVENKNIVYQLWKQGVAYPFFANRDILNKGALEKSFKSKMPLDQRFFLAKMMVWEEINWQSKSLVDLNFSYSGNQFRSLISYSDEEELKWKIEEKSKVVAVDYADFINLKDTSKFAKRKLIILDLNAFEQALTFVTSKKVSWNDFIYSFKQIYDPETQRGNNEHEDLVRESLADVDLFFGLASMNWKKIDSESYQFLVNEKTEANTNYEAIQTAAQNFIAKMKKVNKIFKSDRIDWNLEYLENFLESDPTQIRWIEIGDKRLVFSLAPLSLETIATELLSNYKKILFTASLGSEKLVQYFEHRLNLKNFDLKKVGQQELRKRFEVIISAQNSMPQVDSEGLMRLLEKLDYPAALLMPSSSALRAFYEANFKKLQEKYKVAAQSYSGGSNKLLENFSIHSNGLLIVTDNFILKQSAKRIKVRDVVMTRLPFEQFNHPLFAAQAEKYPNQFIDFNIPRALHNFHSIIRFFFSSDLERIYILDQKIHKDYGKYFVEYLKSLPFVDIKYE